MKKNMLSAQLLNECIRKMDTDSPKSLDENNPSDFETGIKRLNAKVDLIERQQQLEFRENILKFLKRLIFFQIFMLYLICAVITIACILEIPIFKTPNLSIIKYIFSFLSQSQKIILGELVAILFFIVRNTFQKKKKKKNFIQTFLKKIKDLFK